MHSYIIHTVEQIIKWPKKKKPPLGISPDRGQHRICSRLRAQAHAGKNFLNGLGLLFRKIDQRKSQWTGLKPHELQGSLHGYGIGRQEHGLEEWHQLQMNFHSLLILAKTIGINHSLDLPPHKMTDDAHHASTTNR